jgi:hypothetical protein
MASRSAAIARSTRRKPRWFCRIFHDYVVGKSAKRIAAELNRDGISAPGGGDWGFSTINGNAKRGNGILNNENVYRLNRMESAAFHQGP